MRAHVMLAVAMLAATGAVAAGTATPRPRAAWPSRVYNPEQVAANAEKWLALVDGAKYGEAWDSSAKVFRDTGPRDAFVHGAANQRAALGSVVSRVRTVVKKRESAPGNPQKEEYLVVEYTTDFSKEKTTESVAMALEGGVWRVSGYQVAPR